MGVPAGVEVAEGVLSGEARGIGKEAWANAAREEHISTAARYRTTYKSKG